MKKKNTLGFTSQVIFTQFYRLEWGSTDVNYKYTKILNEQICEVSSNITSGHYNHVVKAIYSAVRNQAIDRSKKSVSDGNSKILLNNHHRNDFLSLVFNFYYTIHEFCQTSM